MASRQPFSRHGSRGDGDAGGSSGERLVAVYEFAAAEYGWTPKEVEEELSDEQLIALLDAATDRRSERATADFESSVEAARVGYIFARDQKQYAKWRRSTERRNPRKVGLTGTELETAIRGIAQMFPENVIVGTV